MEGIISGIRVLVVDDDPVSLRIVGLMLMRYKYEVVTIDHPVDALNLLKDQKGQFNLVVTDIHMPDINGFDLVSLVQKEFNIPVIMISADDNPESMTKGMACGASSYLLKPLNSAAIQNLWQYVYYDGRSKGSEQRRGEPDPTVKHGPSMGEEMDYSSSSNVKNDRPVENRKKRFSKGAGEEYDEDSDGDDVKAAMKKTRMVWTPKLHEKFVAAFNYLGPKKAVPKKILELMNIKGVSRTNIASHLQKYRLYLKGNKEPSQQPATGNRFWDFRYLSNAMHNQGLPADDFLDHTAYGNTMHSFYTPRNFQPQWTTNRSNFNHGISDFQSFGSNGFGESPFRTKYVGLQLCTREGMIGLRNSELEGGSTASLVNITPGGKRPFEEYGGPMIIPKAPGIGEMSFNHDAGYADAGNVFVNSDQSFQVGPQMPVLEEQQPQQLEQGIDSFSELMTNAASNDFSYLICNEGNQYNQEQGVEGIIMDPQFGVNELFFDEHYPAEI